MSEEGSQRIFIFFTSVLVFLNQLVVLLLWIKADLSELIVVIVTLTLYIICVMVFRKIAGHGNVFLFLLALYDLAYLMIRAFYSFSNLTLFIFILLNFGWTSAVFLNFMKASSKVKLQKIRLIANKVGLVGPLLFIIGFTYGLYLITFAVFVSIIMFFILTVYFDVGPWRKFNKKQRKFLILLIILLVVIIVGFYLTILLLV